MGALRNFQDIERTGETGHASVTLLGLSITADRSGHRPGGRDDDVLRFGPGSWQGNGRDPASSGSIPPGREPERFDRGKRDVNTLRRGTAGCHTGTGR
ncbi:MAG TPA: hypothetical protein VJY33_01600 [Isosphaeraceae bacterium]|nr:hypothetical protein [Isosphaeraceae bacterium]